MTEQERLEIVNWVCDTFFDFYEVSPSTPRLIDYRLSILDKNVPMAIWKIKKKIIDKEKLGEYIREPFFEDVLTVILPGGGLHTHTDPNLDDFIHTRFNVFIQVPKRTMKTFYGDETVDAKERHYTMCRSGIDFHGVTLHNENKARITISFGYLIPRQIVDRMYYNLASPLPDESQIIKRPNEIKVANYWLINSIIHNTNAVFKERYGRELKDLYNLNAIK